MWRTYGITAYCNTVLYADCVSSVPRLTLLELWMHSQRASQVMLVVKNLPPNAGDVRDVVPIPGLGRFPWRRKMATHSSILALKIPQTEEPSGRQSMGSQRVRYNWSDWAHHNAFSEWNLLTPRGGLTASLRSLQHFNKQSIKSFCSCNILSRISYLTLPSEAPSILWGSLPGPPSARILYTP